MESLFNYIFQDIKYRQQCDSVTTKHMFINYIANYSVNLLPCFSGVFFAGDGIVMANLILTKQNVTKLNFFL